MLEQLAVTLLVNYTMNYYPLGAGEGRWNRRKDLCSQETEEEAELLLPQSSGIHVSALCCP